MEITIILDGNEESSAKEVISQIAYLLRRELNPEEIERVHKSMYLCGLNNHYDILMSAIAALGGLTSYSRSWRNYSIEEIEREGDFEEATPVSSC